MKTSKKKNRPASRSAKAVNEKGIQSSGNVFADMGLPDAEERFWKARLAHEICALIADEKLTQVQAAKRLGIDQPKISALMRGRLEAFSTDRLLRFITSLDRDVWIVIREPKGEVVPILMRSNNGWQMLNVGNDRSIFLLERELGKTHDLTNAT